MSGFDSLGYAQKLRAVGVPSEQAETEAALIRDEVLSRAATKGDLLDVGRQLVSVEQRLEGKIALLEVKIDRVEERLKADIKLLDQSMTIKLTAATVVAIGAITALQKLLGM